MATLREPNGTDRPELATLVRALAALPDAERQAVVAAAEKAAGCGEQTVSWESFKAALGVVNLGGHAVEDCDRLYDG